MAPHSNRQMPAVIGTLRQRLRGAGHTNRSAAQAIGVSEATVKRWLAGKGLTTDRLEDLCQLAGVSLVELLEDARPRTAEVAGQLTMAQEKALAADHSLSFTLFIMLSGASPRDIVADFGVSPDFVERRVAKLERLALVDRLPGGNVRPLVDRKIAWVRGPLRESFERHAKRSFVDMDFSSPDTMYAAEPVKLSPVGVMRVHALLQRVRLDVQALSDEDRRDRVMAGRWYWTLFAAREFDTAEVRALADPIDHGFEAG